MNSNTSCLTSAGMLDKAVYSGRCTKVMVNVDFSPGSSRQGKAFLASVGWNLEVARYLLHEREEFNHPRNVVCVSSSVIL